MPKSWSVWTNVSVGALAAFKGETCGASVPIRVTKEKAKAPLCVDTFVSLKGARGHKTVKRAKLELPDARKARTHAAGRLSCTSTRRHTNLVRSLDVALRSAPQ